MIVSPYVRPGSIIRPTGLTPFDHTSILATLRQPVRLRAPHGTRRGGAGSDRVAQFAARYEPSRTGLDHGARGPAGAGAGGPGSGQPPNDLQRSLSTAAVQLPTAGAEVGAHVNRLASVPDLAPSHATTGEAATDVRAHMKAFLGKP